MDVVLLYALNGLSFAMLLFLMAAGLSLIFGLMGILNLAHGSFYLLGAYIGLTIVQGTGNFLLGVLAAGLAVAVLGVGVQRMLLQRMAHDHLAQVLLTFGLVLVIADGILWTWGGTPTVIQRPAWAAGSVQVGPVAYPLYRVVVIGLGLGVAGLLWLFQERTKLGAVVRAGVDDEEMAGGVGIDVPRVFGAVFALGALLAAVAGVLGGPFVGLGPGKDLEVLLFSLVVVVVGGLGSLRGAFVGAILVGLLDNVGKLLVPQLALFAVFAPMVLVLAVRPRGIFGKSGV